MQPLDAREWLEAEHLAGNRFAAEILVTIAAEPHLQECQNMVDDLKRVVPDEIEQSPDPWRLVEWISDRLALLEEVEEIVTEQILGVEQPKRRKPLDVADQLREMFDSPRWLEYDL